MCDEYIEKYKDVRVSIDDRIKDLITRMTIQEKVRQLDQYGNAEIVTKKTFSSNEDDD